MPRRQQKKTPPHSLDAESELDEYHSEHGGGQESPASVHMTTFPSLDEITGQFSAIFGMISARQHNMVEKFLAEHGVVVDIVPKVGCSPLHYTKFNVANCVNSCGDTPLITAARVDYEMVRIVLKYGGNPNETNQDRSSPLSIAAVSGDRDSIDILLMAGANLTAAVIKLTSYLRYQPDSQLKDTGFSVKSLTFLLYNGVYLKCRDPFRAAFDVSKNIEEIENVRDEFRAEFELLIRDADVFAYRLLDHCDKMWEAREVLSNTNGLLRRAIDERKMRFVAHPFSQQIILEEWYGKLAFKWACGKISVAFKYVFSPLLLPLYLLEYFCCQKFNNKIGIMESKCADHMRLLFTPFMCFITDVINYFILLGLLVSVCVIPKERAQPENWEIALWICLLSRLSIELDQMVQQGLWRYFKNIFNFIELIACAVLLAASLFRIYIWATHEDYNQEDINHLTELHTDILYITYMYAFAEVILILRWLNFLEISSSLGPLLLALKYLLVDVVKFVLIVLLTCVIGATIAVYAITNNISVNGVTLNSKVDGMITESLTKDQILQNHGLALKGVPKYFKTFVECLKSIIWATFGLLEMPVSIHNVLIHNVLTVTRKFPKQII